MKKINKSLLTVIICSVLSISIYAQKEADDEIATIINLEGDKGYIIDSNNKRIEAYIQLKGDMNSPWINQRVVKALPIDRVDKTVEKQKFTRYNKSDIIGYGVGNRNFKLIDFMNIRASMKHSSNGKEASIFDQIQSVKNISKQKHFAEVIVDGKYKIYKLYGYPKDVDVQVGDEEIKQAEQELQLLRTTPSLLMQKEDGKIEFIKIENLEKIVKECEAIAKKLEAGDYNAVGYKKPEKKGGLMGKMMKMSQEQQQGNIEHEKLFISIFNDLNQACN